MWIAESFALCDFIATIDQQKLAAYGKLGRCGGYRIGCGATTVSPVMLSATGLMSRSIFGRLNAVRIWRHHRQRVRLGHNGANRENAMDILKQLAVGVGPGP
jgi:hypothetical protein